MVFSAHNHLTIVCYPLWLIYIGTDRLGDRLGDGFQSQCTMQNFSHCTDSDSDPYSLFLHRTEMQVLVRTRIRIGNVVRPLHKFLWIKEIELLIHLPGNDIYESLGAPEPPIRPSHVWEEALPQRACEGIYNLLCCIQEVRRTTLQ